MTSKIADRRNTQLNDEFIVDDLLQMSSAKNYNQWIYSIIAPHIGKCILEVGAGIGNLTERLVIISDQLTAVEPNPNCQAILKGKFQGNTKFRLVNSKIESIGEIQKFGHNFDTILMINVLEHIQEDQKTLEQLRALLMNEGNLVLIVPAVKWAYGSIDKSVGHFRRYSITMLRHLLEKCSFHCEALYYFNFVGLLGWFINARISKIQTQQNGQIKTFDQLVPIIAKMESLIRPPLGMSLFAVGKKRE